MDTQGERLCQQIDLLVASADADSLPPPHPSPKESARSRHFQGCIFLSRTAPHSQEASTAAHPSPRVSGRKKGPAKVFCHLRNRRRWAVHLGPGICLLPLKEGEPLLKAVTKDTGFRGQKFFSSEHDRVRQRQPFLPEFLYAT